MFYNKKHLLKLKCKTKISKTKKFQAALPSIIIANLSQPIIMMLQGFQAFGLKFMNFVQFCFIISLKFLKINEKIVKNKLKNSNFFKIKRWQTLREAIFLT